jgi:UDP-glucose 4-epimerase
MLVLIIGSVGYIESHAAKRLAQAGYEPVMLDNLCQGHRWTVRWSPLVEMDFSDRAASATDFNNTELPRSFTCGIRP